MRITILGAGKLGISIAQALVPGGHDITILDRDAEIVDKLRSRMDIQVINANAEDIDSLKNANVHKSDVLIACTHSDDKNIVLCSIGKELGVKKCMARVRSVKQFSHLDLIKRAMNIDMILNPDFICANEIYKNLTQQVRVGEGYQMVNGIALIEFKVESLPDIINKSIKESVAAFNGLLVAAISRNGNVIIPNGDIVFEEGDDVYAIGTREDVRKMRDNLHGVSSMNHIHNVMIAGGGKTALFLAKMLTAANINVKIIENDRKRAEYLAVGLNRATIVYGDATDSDLLFEEELDNMDAFVACTGFDEENFMLAMYAKQHGLTNAIAKMTRRSYDQMLERIGDVMTINTVELCTASVLRSIKEDNNIVFANMIQGQAEFLELRVDENVNIAGKTLMQLSIPNGILVAAVFRDGELIVPRGSTKFEKNDRILVLSLLSMIGEVQNVFKTRLSKEF